MTVITTCPPCESRPDPAALLASARANRREHIRNCRAARQSGDALGERIAILGIRRCNHVIRVALALSVPVPQS
jgi:hypothetical protein